MLITGFQAEGTLGRALVDGAKSVRIFGEEVPVRASIHTIGGLSAHADLPGLLAWTGHFRKPPARTFVVHGEAQTALDFAEHLRADRGWQVDVPQPGERIEWQAPKAASKSKKAARLPQPNGAEQQALRAAITEGGVIGLVLLINHWLGVPASVASPLLDAASYVLAFKFLGWDFLLSAGVASVSLAGFYRIWECLPPMLPDLTPWPLAAALLGGVFVGVGVGLIVRQGGSSGGDDALALVIHKLTGWRLSRAYLFTDLTVLFASLSYIPFRRIAFSLVTVTVSSLLIDFIKEWQPKTNV